jgi:hypothetical protein
MGPRAGLDDVEKRIILLLPGIEPPTVQPIACESLTVPEVIKSTKYTKIVMLCNHFLTF